MMPSVDIEDRGKDFRLTVDLPGFDKENVNIEVSEDSVMIHAKKIMSEEEKNKNYIRRERLPKHFTEELICLKKSGLTTRKQV